MICKISEQPPQNTPGRTGRTRKPHTKTRSLVKPLFCPEAFLSPEPQCPHLYDGSPQLRLPASVPHLLQGCAKPSWRSRSGDARKSGLSQEPWGGGVHVVPALPAPGPLSLPLWAAGPGEQSGGQQSPKHTAVFAYGRPVGSSFLLWAPALGALSSQGTDRSSSCCFLMLGHRELQAEAVTSAHPEGLCCSPGV